MSETNGFFDYFPNIQLSDELKELPVPERLSSSHRDRYIKEEDCEHTEFNEFARLMQPVKSLFADLGVDFDIQFYTFKSFLSLLDKTKSELDYLKRYTFD